MPALFIWVHKLDFQNSSFFKSGFFIFYNLHSFKCRFVTILPIRLVSSHVEWWMTSLEEKKSFRCIMSRIFFCLLSKGLILNLNVNLINVIDGIMQCGIILFLCLPKCPTFLILALSHCFVKRSRKRFSSRNVKCRTSVEITSKYWNKNIIPLFYWRIRYTSNVLIVWEYFSL